MGEMEKRADHNSKMPKILMPQAVSQSVSQHGISSAEEIGGEAPLREQIDIAVKMGNFAHISHTKRMQLPSEEFLGMSDERQFCE